MKSSRSINLALSNRGREALRYIGLEDLILSKAISMKGRFIHFRSGKNQSFLYDKHKNQVSFINTFKLNKTHTISNLFYSASILFQETI